MDVDVSIVSSGHDAADARLHREVAALDRQGLRTEVLALGLPEAAPPEAARVRTWARAGNLRRTWLAMSLPWRARGACVVALDPDSAFGAWVVRTVQRNLTPRRAWLFVSDVHEDYAKLLRDRSWAHGPSAWAGRFWARLGISASRRADLVVVADDHLLPDLPRRLVVKNLPDPKMLPEAAARDLRPRAVYVGVLRRSTGLWAMLDVIQAATGWELDLVGPVASEDEREFHRRLSAPELHGRVRWHDRMPPREAWEIAQGAWIGLSLMEPTDAFLEAVPSKLYEYMASGIPIISTNLPRAAALVSSSGAGFVVDDPQEAVSLLRTLAASPRELDSAAEAGRKQAESWLGEASPMDRFAGAISHMVCHRTEKRRKPKVGSD